MILDVCGHTYGNLCYHPFSSNLWLAMLVINSSNWTIWSCVMAMPPFWPWSLALLEALHVTFPLDWKLLCHPCPPLPLPSLFVGRFVGTKLNVMSTIVNVMTFNTTMFTFFSTWRCGLGCRFLPLVGFYFFVWRPPQVQHTTFWSCSIKKDGEGPNWPPLAFPIWVVVNFSFLAFF